MRKEDFKKGENINLNVFNYDDQGNEYIKNIKGIVFQITDNFVTIDNGKYKESFKYSEFEACSNPMNEGEPYDLSLDSYSGDIVNQCIDNLKKGKVGYVFNESQLQKVYDNLDKKYYNSVHFDGEIFYIKKI